MQDLDFWNSDYCAGAKPPIAADCDPWRRTAKNKPIKFGGEKASRAPFTVDMRANSE